MTPDKAVVTPRKPEVSPPGTDPVVVMGKLSAAHGIRGWLRVESFTEPAQALGEYQYWFLGSGVDSADPQWRVMELDAVRSHSRPGALVARLKGCGDRDQALALVGLLVGIPRSKLPELPEGEYYWRDLIGLEVRTREGRSLGRVIGLMETGANDVLRVQAPGEPERLVPYLPGPVVVSVDRATQCITVDWDPDF